MTTPPIYNIIVAAGKGTRFGAELPKQFCMLNEYPVLMHTINQMRNALPTSKIAVVLNRDFVDFWRELCEKFQFPSPQIVTGGETRWQSVKNAIDSITEAITDNSIITIHDGARPIIDKQMVARTINATLTHSGAIPVIPVTDSIRQLQPNGTSCPVDRSCYRAVQTPQAFQAHKLIKAYTLPYCDSFTDDASVLAAANFDDIALVEGDPKNIKITHPSDIKIAAIYMSEQ